MKISDSFQIVMTLESDYKWVLAGHDISKSAEDELAENLAVRIMEHRLRGCPHHFVAWQNKCTTGNPLSPTSQSALVAFTEKAFGLPSNPTSIASDHLEGLISQYLWYFLCLETADEPIVHNIPPGFKATDPGGDALIIHRLNTGDLMFRLWEIKKFIQRSDNSTTSANSTLTDAYQQLEAKAHEYLARYTSFGQELDPELKDFFGLLIDMWEDAKPEAAAGVALNTSRTLIPTKNFENLPLRFSRFVSPVRLMGMISAVDDFATFAIKVRRAIWKGL
jgi:hypothetical protein